MANTPWAILLCKFADDQSEPYPRQRFEELFTTVGSGKFNMVDFFRDMSHGQIDLTGSQVFPSINSGNLWYNLAQKRSDYTGSGANQAGRNALLAWGRNAAANEISGFFKFVVVTNVPADLFGGLGGVAADDGRWPNGMSSLSPSLIGQEMGHGYGLMHSRVDGSTADYMDPWDVMSTANTPWMAPHPFFTELDVQGRPIFRIGPGLNAANMSAMGWLDMSRVWRPEPYESSMTVQLRPLHRVDLPGYLCAQVGQYFIEFRMNELWDAGLDSPLVLIHDLFDGRSYVYAGDSGRFGLLGGDFFAQGYTASVPSLLHGSGTRIDIVSIDAPSRIATIRVSLWQSNYPAPAGPGTVFGGVANDGGGWVFVNGNVFRVPPRSPLISILELIGEIEAAQSLRNGLAAGIVRRQSFEAIAAFAARQIAQMDSLETPPPPPPLASQRDEIPDE